MLFSFIVDLAVAAAAVILILLMAAVEWCRQPYSGRDFSLAMDRICRGVEELWRVQDLARFDGWEDSAARNDALRRLCQGMIGDMLRNTVYILERAEPGLRCANNAEAVCLGAGEVIRRGSRLIFGLRRAQVVLMFHRDNETLCAITAEMSEQYAELWSEVVRWIESRVVDDRARIAGRSCRRRVGAGERAAL